MTEAERLRVEAGEHANGILQALCRASVRKCIGEACAPCEAYVIAHPRSGIPDLLGWVFPECRIESWEPLPLTLTGRLKEAAEIVLEWAGRAKPGDTLKFTEVQRRMGMARQDFKNHVRQHPVFRQFLDRHGIVETGGQTYFTSWTLAERD